MKKLLLAWLLCIPAVLFAQEDPKYLAGAVPEVDGKVVFSLDLAVDGQDKAAVYQHMKNWAEDICKRPDVIDNKSRIVIENEASGEIGVTCEEYMVFSSGLGLDRTRIFYNLRINCDAGLAKIKIQNIHYLYDENRNGGTRYNAEEIITDKECLTKDKTKMYKQLAKFRKKTIDMKDNLFDSASKAFGFQQTNQARKIEPAVVQKAEEPKALEVAPVKQVTAAPVNVQKNEEPAKKAEEPKPAKRTHIAPDLSKVEVKDTVSFTVQEGSALYELLEKTGKATLTIISENGTAQVLQFQKASSIKSADGKSCTFTGELSK